MAEKWRARTRADDLTEQAEEHLSRMFEGAAPRNASGQFVTADVVDAEARAPKEACDGCRRVRPVFELVLADGVPGVEPGAYCGACRGRMARQGVATRATWAAATGAPPTVVAKFNALGY